jgi:hypothetical protein
MGISRHPTGVGDDPEHVAVKKLGRQKFYTEYRAQICELVRESKFRT